MSAGEPGSIIRDYAALDDFFPDLALRGRDAEFKAVLKCLGIVTKRIRPLQVWIAGPPGAGKTALARHVLSQVTQPGRVYGVYVNCWENKTLHAMLDCLVRELRILGTEKIDAQFKLEKLRQHIEGKALLVVLDELDRLPVRERESMLYALSNLGTVGLLCISNSRSAFLDMDERVRSRLSPYLLSLGHYTADQLVEILNDRASWALRVGAWNEALLRRISNLAGGDARVAVRTLKLAAQLAEASGASEIEDQHIEHGWARVAELQRKYLLGKLTPHHALIYDVVTDLAPVDASRARYEYRTRCQSKALVPVAGRTFSKYVSQLIRFGLVQPERAATWPNVRVLRPDLRFLPSALNGS